MSDTRWCAHCDARPSRRADGVCDACNAYRHKYGQLPPDDVLVRRQRRQDERRFEAMHILVGARGV